MEELSKDAPVGCQLSVVRCICGGSIQSVIPESTGGGCPESRRTKQVG